jgi:UDP-2-acetamido-3-amino-2,3-dideoxy-glucuronate N-acetyltransferase
MKSIVVGLGETGRPLFNILKRSGMDVYGYDDKTKWAYDSIALVDVINICIPYSDKFIEIVKDYQKAYNPGLTIIHSTVPIGTTIKIPNAVHSPILGKHDNMEKSLLSFTKWIGGPMAEKAREYLENAGMSCRCVATSDETEALKLLCLAKYGMSIAFAQYCKSISEQLGFNYQDILDWDINYNAEVDTDKQRPLIYNPDGEIGGHCVVPGTGLLHSRFPNPILNEVLVYNKERAVFKVWHPVNVYPTAKIGNNVSIGMFSEIGNNVVIEDNVRIGAMCFIPEGVTIEKNAWIGPNCVMTNDRFPPSGKENWEKILIKQGARIGAGSTILPGIEIGEGALIGAGSVVTKNVPTGETWVGVPAKRLINSILGDGYPSKLSPNSGERVSSSFPRSPADNYSYDETRV